MVSAGIGAGASQVAITCGSHFYRLSMPGAYLPESQVLGSFARSSSDSDSATDLVMALQTVFAEGAQSVQILLAHPELGRTWSERVTTTGPRSSFTPTWISRWSI